MVFDVMLNEGVNEAGKQKAFIYRVHSSELGSYLFNALNKQGKKLISIIPLYPVRDEKERFAKDEVGMSLGDMVMGNDQIIGSEFVHGE